MASIRSGIGESMEDRYLFKAKFDDSDRWVKGQLVEVNDTYLIIPNHASKILAGWFSASNIIEVKKDTICRYTGLKDRNGNLIWENDIVKINNSKVNTLITFRDFEIICTIPNENIISIGLNMILNMKLLVTFLTIRNCWRCRNDRK